MEVLTAQRGREFPMGWATWPIDMFAVLHKSGYLEKAVLPELNGRVKQYFRKSAASGEDKITNGNGISVGCHHC